MSALVKSILGGGGGNNLKAGDVILNSNKIAVIPETGLTSFIIYSETNFDSNAGSGAVPVIIYKKTDDGQIAIIFYKWAYVSSMSTNSYYTVNASSDRFTVTESDGNTVATIYSSSGAKYNTSVQYKYIGYQ